jgi:hypothetical protein
MERLTRQARVPGSEGMLQKAEAALASYGDGRGRAGRGRRKTGLAKFEEANHVNVVLGQMLQARI